MSQQSSGLANGSVPPVVALVQTFNEEMILEATLNYLTSQGIGVYVLDNWSTDETVGIAESFRNRGVMAVERFPAIQPPPEQAYNLKGLLERKSDVAMELSRRGVRWVMHYDADEIRESPWAGVSLREGLERVAAEGFNVVDHRVINFVPTDEGFKRGMSPVEHFTHYVPHTSTVRHGKAWLQGSARVDLAGSGGHFVKFRGRKVYPVPFLIRHYPILSTEHGQRKVFRERKPRYAAEGRAMGWHKQYDALQQEHRFVRSPDEPGLMRYDEETFKRALVATRVDQGKRPSLFKRLMGLTRAT